LVPLAGGIVMPGVHDGAPASGVLQLEPMFPPVGAQFEPLQQTGACGGVCGVHVNPGAQPPIESQRQPCSPTRHVEGPPPEVAPELLPPSDPELPENPPELEPPPLPDPEAPEDAPELAPPPLPDPEAPEDAPELDPLPPLLLPLLPHAAATAMTGIARASEPRNERGADGSFMIVFPSGWPQRSRWARDKRISHSTIATSAPSRRCGATV
jgi:hypothetical protein